MKTGKMKSGRGHFLAAAQKLAKKKSGKLQTGAKNGMQGAGNIGGSTVPANSTKVMPTPGQLGLNPKQQGC